MKNKINLLVITAMSAALTTPAMAAIDVSDVSDEIVSASVAILAIGGAVIGAGMALGSVKNAARWALGLFRQFMR